MHMSIQARREKERQARVRAIQKSAWKVFLKDGLENAKISEIAKNCSLGLATLYYYFKDKRQIVYSLMLEYKTSNNAILIDLIKSEKTLREYLIGYVYSHLDYFDKFRFFVLADTYYNYHLQYDLNDPVIRSYDTITRNNGEIILSCLTRGMSSDQIEKTRVGISMMIGFLRRYALIPQGSWPRNESEKSKMIDDFEKIAFMIFTDIGYNLDTRLFLTEQEELAIITG